MSFFNYKNTDLTQDNNMFRCWWKTNCLQKQLFQTFHGIGWNLKLVNNPLKAKQIMQINKQGIQSIPLHA